MKLKKVLMTQIMTPDYHSLKDNGQDVDIWSYKVAKTVNTTEFSIGDVLTKSAVDKLSARADVTVEIN